MQNISFATENAKSFKQMTVQRKTLLKDIALAAGVSKALVSFVLSGQAKAHRVNEATAKRIMDIANELDYRPNKTAQRLRSGRSNIIGVVVSDISNPFFSSIARLFENLSEQYDYSVIFSSSDERKDTMHKVVDNLISRDVDGLVIVPCENSESFVQSLASRNIPLVLLDRYFPSLDVCHVSLDNRKAAFDATGYLLSKGYRKPAMIAYDVNLNHMHDRIEGYRSAMAEAGHADSASVYYVDSHHTTANAEAVVRQALDENADSFVFATNVISIACLYYIRNLDRRTQQKLGLVGFDGNPVFDFFDKPIAYIEQPLEALVQHALESITALISGKEASSAVIEGRLLENYDPKDMP